MAGYRDKKPYGERVPTRTDTEKPPAPSPIPCLPYFPNLRRALGSDAATVLFTYLETYFPTPQDDELTPIRSRTFEIHLQSASIAIQQSRRTLRVAFSVIAKWFDSEDDRFTAARVAREFLIQRFNSPARTVFFSVVGPRSFLGDAIISVRRNHHAVADLVRRFNLPAFDPAYRQGLPPALILPSHVEERARLLRSASMISNKKELADILISPSVLSGDRRRVRYGRLREAVERGLAGEEALKAKQAKGFNRKRGEKRPSPIVSEAVDPEFRPSDGTLLD